MTEMTLVAGEADTGLRERLDQEVNAFNVAATGYHDARLLSIAARGDSGDLCAGLYGWTWGGCGYIELLWVRDDQRGNGLGTRLLAAAETEIQQRGCDRVALDTHSFQAPGFYARFGYTECGRTQGYPHGHDSIHLLKQLRLPRRRPSGRACGVMRRPARPDSGSVKDASGCASFRPMTAESHADCPADQTPVPDPESAGWVRALSACGAERDHAAARLHEALLRVARAEFARRSGQLRISGPELDDLAHQAAADAVVAVIAKVGQFRGESRFSTWAYRFVILEVSAKIGRHFWRQPQVPMDAADWDQLPDRYGLDPARESEWRDLARALRQAVEQELTEHQRRIFTAIVVEGVPLDALVAKLGTSRGAVYKTMFDARRKLRASLVANGYLDKDPEGH